MAASVASRSAQTVGELRPALTNPTRCAASCSRRPSSAAAVARRVSRLLRCGVGRREGEQIFLPKGYQYALRSTGEPAINVFAIAGGPTAMAAIMGPEAGDKLKEAGRRLGRA